MIADETIKPAAFIAKNWQISNKKWHPRFSVDLKPNI
jgi:hypothetical protein